MPYGMIVFRARIAKSIAIIYKKHIKSPIPANAPQKNPPKATKTPPPKSQKKASKQNASKMRQNAPQKTKKAINK
jgi:hypothetical protein